MDEKSLFDNLAEQAAPQRPRGVPRLQEPRRDQIALRAVDLEALVAADDPVRDLWVYVEGLDLGELSELYERIEARQGEPGRAPITPRLLLALWLQATLRGVGSAREVARLCSREISFQWLCGGVGVNHHTLSDFRVANGDLLNRLLSQSVAVLVKEGLVNLDRLSLDGLRVRAAAGAASFRRGESLKKCLDKATALVASLSREVADDPMDNRAGQDRRQQAAQKRAAADRLARVKAAQQRHAELQVERQRRKRTNRNQTAKQKEPRASTTDPEARVMKMPDGGFRPAYNGQFIADPKSGVILGVAVDTTGSDHGWLKPMLKPLKERFGRTPKEVLVDGGYSSAPDIEWAAQPQNGAIAVFMAATNSKHGTDPYAAQPRDGIGVAAWRARMASPEGQAIYKLRSTHECINAHLRQRRLHQLTVRGTAKVMAVFLWHALAHNLARAGALRRMTTAMPA